MGSIRSAATIIAAAWWAGAAAAAPCAVFTDVEDTSAFCTNVEWMYNRGITLGCSATTYCPADGVTRLQMAVFMNRLANALFPLTCTTGQVMKWNGTAWACADDSNTPPAPRALECVRQYGSYINVPANTYGFGVAATCLAGFTATGLGIEAAANVVMADSVISSTGGTVFTYNLGPTTQSTRAWVQCCRVPGP